MVCPPSPLPRRCIEVYHVFMENLRFSWEKHDSYRFLKEFLRKKQVFLVAVSDQLLPNLSGLSTILRLPLASPFSSSYSRSFFAQIRGREVEEDKKEMERLHKDGPSLCNLSISLLVFHYFSASESVGLSCVIQVFFF